MYQCFPNQRIDLCKKYINCGIKDLNLITVMNRSVISLANFLFVFFSGKDLKVSINYR